MGFYLRYLEQADYQVSAIEYEVIVKSYRGSEPYITTINVTEEILEFQKVFMQQMDWAIREMCEFYISCREVEPWPMSNTSCITQWGECEYLPVCSGTKSLDDPKLYKIKEPK